jgi:ubiquinone/menaquinone biosynthesis C-methylase UbiE
MSHRHDHPAPAGDVPRDAHGNPLDLERYLERLESPERAAWQKPDEVVRELGLRAGDVVCEIGGGPGYFSLRLARAVGPAGRVFAVDAEPRMLELLRRRMREQGVANITPVLGLGDDPLVPDGMFDLVLMVNAFHHVHDRVGYLERIARLLRPAGRFVNIDFHETELPVGPPPAHKLSRRDFQAAAEKAGLELVAEKDFLPYQYFLALAQPSGRTFSRNSPSTLPAGE